MDIATNPASGNHNNSIVVSAVTRNGANDGCLIDRRNGVEARTHVGLYVLDSAGRARINTQNAAAMGTLPRGGAIGQFLTKTGAGDFAVDWASGTGGGSQGPPGQGVPTGGTTGQVLAKTSNANFDTAWTDRGVPAGGTTGQVLGKTSNADYAATWIDAPTGGGGGPGGLVRVTTGSVSVTSTGNTLLTGPVTAGWHIFEAMIIRSTTGGTTAMTVSLIAPAGSTWSMRTQSWRHNGDLVVVDWTTGSTVELIFGNATFPSFIRGAINIGAAGTLALNGRMVSGSTSLSAGTYMRLSPVTA